MSTLEDDAIGGNLDDFDKLGARESQGAPRCHVFRVTRDPQTREPYFLGNRPEEGH